MRRIAMTALVLLPVLAAHAQSSQTSTSTVAQASAPSTLQAKVTAPPALHAAISGKSAAPAAAAADGSDTMIPVHENVIERNSDGDDNSGTLSYTILGGEPIVAAKLVQTTPIALSLKDIRSGAFGTTVVVEMTVAKDGTPRNLTVTRSGGDALNKRVIDAVSKYRFKPATQDGLAVESTVTVQIKLQQS